MANSGQRKLVNDRKKLIFMPNKRLIYLTFNDAPSGIYSSQVIDVVKFINSNFCKIQLISFISIRNFLKNRAAIKSEYPNSFVIPMFPGLGRWEKNKFIFRILLLFINPKAIIARGPFAASLALISRSKRMKICYDGRGAVRAEIEEYKVVTDETLADEIKEMEKKSVLESDFRIAVTEKLIKYWKLSFDYRSAKHIVIPCTLNSNFKVVSSALSRKDLGWNSDDIILVYSGSNQGWQSFELLSSFLKNTLSQNKNINVLFLTQSNPHIQSILDLFPTQSKCIWVNHADVFSYLQLADYGLLLREQSVTNQVASPTKFAEYLAAGLKIICSENLGDYSDFVVNYDCGHVVSNINAVLPLKVIEREEKKRLQELTEVHFYKNSNAIKTKYQELISELTS